MSADVKVPEPRVTLDEIKHQAESVKSKAVAEAKGVADIVVGQESTRTLLMVAGVVVVAASIAYFLGTRSGRAAMAEQMFGE